MVDKVIILVHGFNVKDGGAGTTDTTEPFLNDAGYEVEKDEADYGCFSLLMVRFRKHSAVMRIASAIRKHLVNGQEVIVVSHSNGSNYTNKALKLLSRNGHILDRVIEVRISPALNRSTGTFASKCTVFHTKTDIWVRLSALIPFRHPWGNQGAYGYRNGDKRMRNWEYTDAIKGHSDWFRPENVKLISEEIVAAIET